MLAAGIGRRFGGDKQMAEVGPSGEWLMDYALRDARQAGFSEAILVVRPEMAGLVGRPFPLPVQLAFQEKPLGTAHAVWSARHLVTGPFAVINADDYYGKESYVQLADFLKEECNPLKYAVIGFPLEVTLVDSGPVSRAVLQTDKEGYLIDIEEITGLTKDSTGIPAGALVSMNSWALDRSFMDFLEEKIPALQWKNEGRGELYLPHLIRQAMQEWPVRIKVLPARGQWVGITHLTDLEYVRKRLKG